VKQELALDIHDLQEHRETLEARLRRLERALNELRRLSPSAKP
jgi:hypothetical protein